MLRKEDKMIDLVDFLVKTRNYSNSWTEEKLRIIIEENTIFNFDWDRECGEGWASILFNNKFIGYISSFIPLCFCKTDSIEEIKKAFDDKIVIIEANDFDEEKWFIDEYKLKRNMNELCWIIQEGILNTTCFSINDFWYATI